MIPKMGNEVLITEIQLCLPSYCVCNVPHLLRAPLDQCMAFCVLTTVLVMFLVIASFLGHIIAVVTQTSAPVLCSEALIFTSD